jgi:hypothetical protein
LPRTQLSFKNGSGLHRANALTVRAIACHGVKGIGDGANARRNRNLISHESIGMAFAIHAFVMPTDDGQKIFK